MALKKLENSFKNYLSKGWIPILKDYTVTKKFSKNDRIIKEGDNVTGIYFINYGKIKVVSSCGVDNERVLRLSSDGDILGHRGLTSQHYPISAIALTDVEVIFIPISFFRLLIKSNPDFALYLIDFYATDLKMSEDRLKGMIHSDVLTRTSIIICMLIDSYGYDPKKSKKLIYTMARKDMANMAVTTYETITRNLATLEEMNVIKISNKEIYVLNEKELRKIVNAKKMIL